MNLFPLQPYQGKKICVALSGGVDSVSLLHWFKQNANQYSITLSALTCEHGIRGEDSKRDLAFVESLCRDWNILLYTFQADVLRLSRENHRGIEEEGRLFRRSCYRKILSEKLADAVATAHHLDDYAETILFRLIRGTSLSGLDAFDSEEGIIHPLLSVPKKTIMEYATFHALPFVTDQSNFDEAYTRNLLRMRAMPLLEQAVSGAAEHLVQFARKAKADEDYLNELARQQLRIQGGEVRYPLALADPIFRRCAVLAMSELGIKKDYTAAHVTQIKQLACLQSGSRASLPCGIEATREGDCIVLYQSQTVSEESVPFSWGEHPFGKSGVVVTSQKTEKALYADYDAFPSGCEIRTRREGDFIRPYAGQKKTLKKFLTDKKIPARLSARLPIVAFGSEVLCVFSVEISDKVKTTAQTKHTCYLFLQTEM